MQSVYDEDNNQTDFPVWITFKQGYVSGKFLSSLPNGRCRVIILPGQEIIEVNPEDVERVRSHNNVYYVSYKLNFII